MGSHVIDCRYPLRPPGLLLSLAISGALAGSVLLQVGSGAILSKQQILLKGSEQIPAAKCRQLPSALTPSLK